MKYHDFHLRGYSVEAHGATIVLDLVYDHPGRDIQESRIKFSDVACYSFDHTTGAIITGIEEVDIAALAKEQEQKLSFFAKQYGLSHWKTDLTQYVAALETERLRAWRIDSAIGFSGFIIARSVSGST